MPLEFKQFILFKHHIKCMCSIASVCFFQSPGVSRRAKQVKYSKVYTVSPAMCLNLQGYNVSEDEAGIAEH